VALRGFTPGGREPFIENTGPRPYYRRAVFAPDHGLRFFYIRWALSFVGWELPSIPLVNMKRPAADSQFVAGYAAKS